MAQQRRYTLLSESNKAQQRKPAANGQRRSTTSSQHKSAVVHPESALQPVYDVIDALQPDRLKAAYYSLNYRTRWLIVVSTATLVLLWVTINLSMGLAQHIRATSGPFLFEALNAPYGLVDRISPNADPALITVLPVEVDKHILNLVEAQTFIPGVTPVVEAETVEEAAVAEETTVVDEVAVVDATTITETAPVIPYLMGECLFSAAEFDPDAETYAGCLPFAATYLTTGMYEGNGSPIQVAAVQFDPAVTSTNDVMNSLKDYSEQIGRAGNYVIGINGADYFYSSTPELYSFTWAHNGWVYSMSGENLNELESMLKAFPF
ncbi:MAG: hypothetical protein H6672_06700 [Anaerolineaceae bacterium]|nr:hypothetical protein [Anaerolineaceae bacterium]